MSTAVRMKVVGDTVCSQGTVIGYIKNVGGDKIAFYSNGRFMKNLGPSKTKKKDDSGNTLSGNSSGDTLTDIPAPVAPIATTAPVSPAPTLPATQKSYTTLLVVGALLGTGLLITIALTSFWFVQVVANKSGGIADQPTSSNRLEIRERIENIDWKNTQNLILTFDGDANNEPLGINITYPHGGKGDFIIRRKNAVTGGYSPFRVSFDNGDGDGDYLIRVVTKRHQLYEAVFSYHNGKITKKRG